MLIAESAQSGQRFHRKWTMAALFGLFVPIFVWVAMMKPFPQNPGYHDFADHRTLLGVPSFWNVISNVPFAVIGLMGCWWLIRAGRDSGAFAASRERISYFVFFMGEILTCFGSAWYHLGPNNQTLVWDRLVFSLLLTSFLSILITEFVNSRLGSYFLIPAVLLGLYSVLAWNRSEAVGHGDLRLYLLVQYCTLLAIPVISLLSRSRYAPAGALWVFALFGAAKICEYYDGPIYGLTGFWSGHTLKHFVAAAATYAVLHNLQHRRVRAAAVSQMPSRRRGPKVVVLPAATTIVLCALLCGCSIRKVAINKLGNALASGGTTFAADDDPDFVKDAVPFSLKLMESLLAESPKHRELLLASASGFAQYAYVWLQEDADELEDTDLERANALRTRARRMYLRARDYGIRGLETRHREFGRRLRGDPSAAVQAATKGDTALLYWTAVAWGAAISNSKEYPEIVADLPIVEALIGRVTELNVDFGEGAVHSFLIAYESGQAGSGASGEKRAREHFARSMELSKGGAAGPLVSLAENVAVARQDRKEFQELLSRALAINADARPELRLENLVMQKRARWLLGRTDKLFLD